MRDVINEACHGEFYRQRLALTFPNKLPRDFKKMPSKKKVVRRKKISKPKETSLAIRSNNYSLNNPGQMVGMANVLKNYITQNSLSVKIVGRDYVMVEGWQFAGGLLGTFPRIVDVENLSKGSEIKWQAKVEIVNIKTGQVISTGFAVCSNAEGKKKSFDEYAILSMAQTRAIGKAYRNVIGWVIKLAGYEGAPAEEMGKMGEEPPKQVPQDTGKITEKEADDLLMKAINSGFKDKTSAIAGINRLLKTNIKDFAELTKSQAKSVEVALLQKKNAKK